MSLTLIVGVAYTPSGEGLYEQFFVAPIGRKTIKTAPTESGTEFGQRLWSGIGEGRAPTRAVRRLDSLEQYWFTIQY